MVRKVKGALRRLSDAFWETMWILIVEHSYDRGEG